MQISNILIIIYFEDTLIVSVTDSPDFDSQKKNLTGFSFLVVKGYLIKSKPKYNFNK